MDWPSMTSITQITVPEVWRGTNGLLGDAQQQGSSLSCFFPVNQDDYQSAPPDITVDAPARNAPAQVKITNTIIVTDGPETSQSWDEGLWSVTKYTWGYKVTFKPYMPISASGHGPWTARLEAPDLNIQDPTRQPSTDDGDGTLTWAFPPSRHPIPRVTVSLTGPWQVRMNLASDRWPIRWFSDASFTLGDGVLVDIVALCIGWRLLRRRHGNPEKQRLPIAVIFISLVSIIGYVGYVIDDYLWHNANVDAVWKYENIALVAITAFYFLWALGIRWYWAAAGWVFPVAATWAIAFDDFPIQLPDMPVSYYYSYSGAPHDAAVQNLSVIMIPLLLAVVFTIAGTVLWLSRLWPFGKNKKQGDLRELSDTPFDSISRIILLVLGTFIVAGLILGQSAAASYYVWLHYDLWDTGSGAFAWVATDLMNDAHWWIGDGLQWGLGFTVVGGIFAALWAMSADARGVFFGLVFFGPLRPSLDRPGVGDPGDRGDLVQAAAVFAGVSIGTWGFYDGISLPLPFIVAFVGLAGWGLTQKLSKLDWKSVVQDQEIDINSPADRSILVHCRKDLLAASARISTDLQAQKDVTAAPSEAEGDALGKNSKLSTMADVIPLESQSSANRSVQAGQHQELLPELKLPKPVDSGVTALALGPGDTWWDNGVIAVQMGMYLLVIPIAVDIYIAWNTGYLSLQSFPFGLQDAFGGIVSTLLGWVSGLFMFGILVPYLRGIRTPVKGIVLGLISFAAFAADAGVRHALGVTPYPTFTIDGLLAVALFATVGLLLDIRTLRSYNDRGLMSSIYRLGSIRVGVTYATTLVIVAISLWQAIYLTGQTSQQRAQNISNTAQYVNSIGGAGGKGP